MNAELDGTDDCCEHIDLCPQSSDVSCREQARRHAARASEAARRVWFYRPGQWLGWPIYLGNAEGCTRTLLIGSWLTGCVVFSLGQFRYDPDCPECVERAIRPGETA